MNTDCSRMEGRFFLGGVAAKAAQKGETGGGHAQFSLGYPRNSIRFW